MPGTFPRWKGELASEKDGFERFRSPASCPTYANDLSSKGAEEFMPNKRRSSSGKKSSRKYGEAAAKAVESAMRREKKGTLKSGPGGRGGTVKSRKQAIAIGLSEARKKGAKVPKRKAA
jgi:hypothetical protein